MKTKVKFYQIIAPLIMVLSSFLVFIYQFLEIRHYSKYEYPKFLDKENKCYQKINCIYFKGFLVRENDYQAFDSLYIKMDSISDNSVNNCFFFMHLDSSNWLIIAGVMDIIYNNKPELKKDDILIKNMNSMTVFVYDEKYRFKFKFPFMQGYQPDSLAACTPDSIKNVN